MLRFVGDVVVFVTLGAVMISSAIPAWAGDRPERVSVGPKGRQAEGIGGSGEFALSANSRYVVFGLDATNLVSGDTNRLPDIFVHDRKTDQTERISVGSGGIQGDEETRGFPAISADGRYVAFVSFATNLVPFDSNGELDVFVHDRQTGQTERVSVGTEGQEGNSLSGFILPSSISTNGRYVSFASDATNLVRDDTNGSRDIFVHDRQTGETIRVSVRGRNAQANNNSSESGISADGQYVVFTSWATNLVQGDTNNSPDVFVRRR